MRRRFVLSVLAGDLAILGLAFAFSAWVVLGSPLPWRVELRGAAAGATVWPFAGLLTAGLLIGTFVTFRARGTATPRPSYGRAFAIAGIMVMVTALGVAVGRPYYSNAVFAGTIAVWLAGALIHRGVRRRMPWSERMIVITYEKGLVDDLRTSGHADVVAVHDPAGAAPDNGLDDGLLLVLDLRPVLSEEMAKFVFSWHLAGRSVVPLSTIYEQHTGRFPLVHLDEGWELSAPLDRNRYAGFKRAGDTALILVTLPLWLVLGAVIAVTVLLDAGRGVIYRQERVGWNGRPFTLYKFRSMVVDAETDGPQFARSDDVRFTRSGRWLRRTRLDEVPQLWNVLRGDVSLVGPRPERPVFTEQFERSIPFYGYRHVVRPGLTGWAQVNYGYADDEAQTFDKLTYDLYYVKHMSPWLDLEILGRSVWTMVSGFGAK